MCVHLCNFTSGFVKMCLSLESPKETFPGTGSQFSILLNCHTLASTVSDNPQAWLRLACGADTIVNTQTGCGQATSSGVCLEEMGHPTAAGLSIREQVQMCAFILIQPQALSNCQGHKDLWQERKHYVQGCCYRGFFPSWSQRNLCGAPVSPVLSSPRDSAGDLDCLIVKLCYHSKVH